MERMRISKLLPVLAVVAISAPAAHAGWSLTPVVGGVFEAPKVDPAPTPAITSKFGLGFGALADFRALFGAGMDLQVGALYEMTKSGIDGVDGSVKTNWLQVPILFRYNFDKMFSAGIGPYLAFEMGDITAEAGGVSASAPYTGKKMDFGALVSVAAAIPAGSFDAIIDARYNLGLSDLNDPAVAGTSTKSGGFQIWVGPRFAMH